jgi:hypothetical protein
MAVIEFGAPASHIISIFSHDYTNIQLRYQLQPLKRAKKQSQRNAHGCVSPHEQKEHYRSLACWERTCSTIKYNK